MHSFSLSFNFMQEKGLSIITGVSVAIIIIAAIIAYVYIYSQKKNGQLISKRRWIEQLPSFISTLGVLGTFIGITIGLYFFNTENLDQSIPKLLSGLKTAFFTSLAGMVGSLILSRIVNSSFDENDKGVSDINLAAGEICKAVAELKDQIRIQSQDQNAFYRNVSYSFDRLGKGTDELIGVHDRLENMENLLNSFLNISRSQEGAMNSINDKFNDLQATIGNIEDYSIKRQEILDNISSKTKSIDNNLSELLETESGNYSVQEEIVSEIKKFSEVLRGEVDEIESKMKETNILLTNKFDEFSELLKKSNTEALVEVMKKVTEEFQKQMNSLINKLIQENFEQLNNSVERLNTWQQENKAMIASLTQQYKDMAKNFEDTSTTLTVVGRDTKDLVSDGGKLRQIIDSLNKVLIEDQKFVEISNKLAATVDLTKQNMEQFDNSTKALNEWVKKQRHFVEGVQLLIDKLDELNKIRDYNEEFWQETKRKLEEGVGYISQGSKTLNSQLTELDRQFYARLSTTLAELDTCIQAMIKGNRRM